MKKRARVKKSRVMFRGRVFRVRCDEVVEPRLPGEPARQAVVREIVEHHGSVVVLPVLADGCVLLVRQFRYAAGEFLWELVAGHIEPGSPRRRRGERPLEAARRELQEKTGYTARRFELLGSFYPSPGFVTERMHLYRATGLRPGEARPEADESFQVRAFSRRQLKRMLRHGLLRDAKTLVGVLLELHKPA